jgi:hypothetical protein
MDGPAAPARPKFAELMEEPAYTLLPRDYSAEFTGGAPGSAAPGEFRADPSSTQFRENDEEAQRDLDKPAFLRRLGF